ncbi:glycosyltransferase family 9 protein [Chryseobacterium indologenes]|uniref:hypothetical protein n=1 Tax=Chryseobacterium indologenes TaxID=253 RepID=UPI00405956D5
MSNLKNLFSCIENGEKILLSFDSSYFVLNGELDLRIIRTLISTISQYPDNEFIINDQLGLLHKIIEKSGISILTNKNISIISQKINDIDYSRYNTIFFVETLKRESEKILKAKAYSQPQKVIYFSISMIKDLLYLYEKEETLSQACEQELFFPNVMNEIIKRNSLNEMKPVKNIIILDDHLREFYIGDTHMWLSSIRQLQSKTDSTVTIACGNDCFYNKVIQIFTSEPFPGIHIIPLNWDALNIESFDTVICHQNSILGLLHFYQQHPDTFSEKKIYRFAPNTDFNNLRIKYPWDINHLLKNTLGIEKKIQMIKQLKRQTHKEIYLSEEEINAADEWLIENGHYKGNNLFIIFDESSFSEKTLDFSKTLSLIQLILANPKNQIVLFDYQNIGKRSSLHPYLTSSEYHRVISVNGMNIRKEMAIMASPAISSIIGPCTGMMHLANGIYFELLNNKRRAKQQIPSLIVYCGSGIDARNYHPRYWWQGAMVKCIAAIQQQELIIVKELYEMPLDIEEFHNQYLPVSAIQPEHIMSLLN